MPTTYITAPVSGTIGAVRVTTGSSVRAGEIVIVQIATKTETNVTSPVAGKVTIRVQKGAEVKQGDRIAEVTNGTNTVVV